MVYWLACFPKSKVQGTGLWSMNITEELYFFTTTVKGPKGTNKCFSKDWEQGGFLVGLEIRT